jgi:Holliday junction resolvase
MANPAKAKGSAWERAVTEYLRARGLRTQRIPAGSNEDQGDLFVFDAKWPAIQCKNHAKFDLAGWVRDVEQQAHNAGRYAGIVWAKKRGTTDPGKCYVIMSGDAFMTLMEVNNDKRN